MDTSVHAGSFVLREQLLSKDATLAPTILMKEKGVVFLARQVVFVPIST
jgi:hypothetical protein